MLMFGAIFFIFYVIDAIRQDFTNGNRKPIDEVDKMEIIRLQSRKSPNSALRTKSEDILNKIPQFPDRSLHSFKNNPARNFPEVVHTKSTETSDDDRIMSAIKALSYEKIIPSRLKLEHPFFQPNPKTRLEFNDKAVISPSRCDNKTQMIIQILSQPNSVSSRSAIRTTWGSVASGKQWPRTDVSMDIRLLFVIGTRNSKEKESDSFVSWDNSQLRAEGNAYNDILQLSTADTYSNLTRKMIVGFSWINKYCPDIQYVIKADQDVFLNVPMFWQFLTHHGQKNSIYGHVYFHGMVRREGKWTLSKSVVPMTHFPIYTAGSCYVISTDAIAKVLDTYHLFPYVRIEDAFITGIVASVAGIDRYNVNGFTYWEQEALEKCDLVLNRAYVGNHFMAADLKDLWITIEQGNMECI